MNTVQTAQETEMPERRHRATPLLPSLLALGMLTTLVALAPAARAADGLTAPAAETLWPRWQARIAVQSVQAGGLQALRLFDAAAAPRAIQGAALLGDYYFAAPVFAHFRASAGLMTGSMAGLPLLRATAGQGLALSAGGSGSGVALPAVDLPGTMPYVGLGYSGTLGRSGLALSADFGLVAERAAVGSLGRAVFGNQALDGAVRELRLSPVFQLGVRYAF